MTILILGGRGKTATRLSALLQDAQIPFIAGTSSPIPIGIYPSAHFNWLDRETWEAVFNHADFPISAIYLVGAHAPEFVPPMLEFVDEAYSRGVKRFVLLSAGTTKKGDAMMGKAHAHLDKIENIRYVVLRPTWFMENHIEDPHLSWIKAENRIYSATGAGKIPFVSADDIARVAFVALTESHLFPQKEHEYMVLGPELLMAESLGDVLGRKITHVSLSEHEFARFLAEKAGLPADFARMLAMMVGAVAEGSEERLSDDVERLTGRPPVRFVDFAREKRECWM